MSFLRDNEVASFMIMSRSRKHKAGELDAIRLRIIKLREERERGEAEEY